MDFHHPLFQSLALPFVLAFAAAGILRRVLGPVEGRRWAAAGAAFAILAVSFWVLGLRSSPGSLTEKLPWTYAAGGLLGLALQAMRAKALLAWLVTSAVWALVLTDLGATSLKSMAMPWLLGIPVFGAVLSEPSEGATAPAMLFVASLGLAAVAMTAGSALLFELGLSLGFAVAGCALWVWPVARIPFGASGAVAAVIAWMALARATAVLSPVHPAVLLLLAGAFLSGPIVRWSGRWFLQGKPDAATTTRATRAWVRPLIVATVAAIWVAGALALALRSGTEVPAGGQDDPYYTPRW